MQDFNTFDYDITIEQLKEAQKTVKDISVIINGEYYHLLEKTPIDRYPSHHIVYDRR